MEDKRTINIRLKPVYTLEKDSRAGADITDKNLYLFKNGALANCPYKALLAREGVIMLPCGEDCHHFHYVPDTKKVLEPNPSAIIPTDIHKEKIVETGKILVKLTCGCGAGGNGVFFPIANINMGEAKPETSPLKIVQP